MYVGQQDIEGDGRGIVPAGQRKTGRAVRGDYSLKTLVARQIEQDSRVITEHPIFLSSTKIRT
jgi:hypothetical protein